MSQMKDPSLKLFGKVIKLCPKDDHHDNYECTSSCDNFKQSENRGHLEKTSSQEAKVAEPPRSKKGSYSTITEDVKPVANDRECSSQNSHNQNESDDQTSSTNRDSRKPLKKPDKILPCPRCNSMTTKFCYYNNYNVNQPRHFCKDCQRYWTAGGTMRNVPVGAGRRKRKTSFGSQQRHLVVPGPSTLMTSYNSYGFVQENVNVNSFIFENRVIPQGLSGFPISFCSTGNRSIQSRSVHPNQSSKSPSSPSRKHSRDGTMLFFGVTDSNNKDDRVVIPKRLKIDDPMEASNSSIWNTLQLKNNNHVSPPIPKGGFFGGTHKFDDPSGDNPSMGLELNTAAFSRSLTFHESAR